MGSVDLKNHPFAKAIHEARHARIICIGAGASGILAAYKLQRSFKNYSLVCYEKNADIGGTWFENRYPRCACDVPSQLYTWTFEPCGEFTTVYPSAKEVFDYFNRFCNKHNLRRFFKFNHEITKAAWKEDTNEWEVEVSAKDGQVFRDRCDILISATGVLNAWRLPDIPGLDKFKGKLLHTARWDPEYDVADKTVGVIGNGSSAIQLVPAILPDVAKLISFIRSPTYIAPPFGIEQRRYTPEEQARLVSDAEALYQTSKGQELGISSIYPVLLKGSPENEAFGGYVRELMAQKLERQELRDALIPDYTFGCRRITPGTGYLEALQDTKVEVVRGHVAEVTERGCICDGHEYEMDALVCATGFDSSHRPRFPIIGQGGVDMMKLWKDGPQSYFGVSVAKFPNYFTFLGPNSPVGQGSLLQTIEIQADYIMRFVDRWQTENILSFEPQEQAVKDFIEYKEFIMPRMVWTGDCRSWYKNDKTGMVTATYPGSLHHYREVMLEPRYEDYEFRTSGNRFLYLGLGFSRTEMDPTCDAAYQIRREDDSLHHSREARRKVLTKSGTVTPPPAVTMVEDDAATGSKL